MSVLSGEPEPLAVESEDVPPEVLDVAATFVNGFYVAISGEFTRIAFSEVLEGNSPRYRWAIVLPTKKAIDLARVIVELTAPPASLASLDVTEK